MNPIGAQHVGRFEAPEDPAREVLGRIRAAGIPYCVLRDTGATEPSGDLDLLVAEASVERCRALLEQLGFVVRPSRSPFKVVLLRYQAGRTVCLDVHWRGVQYGILYMDETRMLERRIESDGVFRLSPEDELIHLVMHHFLRKGRLRDIALRHMQRLLGVPLDSAYLRNHLDAFGLRPAFEAACAWIRLHERGTHSAAPVRRRLLWAALRARPGNLRRYAAVRFGHRPAAARRGGLIALVGPDGCGKSTVIHALKRRAQDVPTLRVDTTYLGPWGQMHLPWVPALRRAGITPVTRPFGRHVAARSGPYLSPLVKGCLFYAATYVELMYRYLTTVFFSVRDGHWVIADRYVTDLRYMYKERPVSNYPRIRRLICRLFPKPDLLIVLDNQPAVITARKGGLTEPQIEVLRRACLEAAKDYRHEVVTTDRPPDETADYILNRMLALDAPG